MVFKSKLEVEILLFYYYYILYYIIINEIFGYLTSIVFIKKLGHLHSPLI